MKNLKPRVQFFTHFTYLNQPLYSFDSDALNSDTTMATGSRELETELQVNFKRKSSKMIKSGQCWLLKSVTVDASYRSLLDLYAYQSIWIQPFFDIVKVNENLIPYIIILVSYWKFAWANALQICLLSTIVFIFFWDISLVSIINMSYGIPAFISIIVEMISNMSLADIKQIAPPIFIIFDADIIWKHFDIPRVNQTRS